MGFSEQHATTLLDLLGVLLILAGTAVVIAAAVGGALGIAVGLAAAGVLAIGVSWAVALRGDRR